jgi:glycine hydroxymethyltransferase
MLVDLRGQGLTGKAAEAALDLARITVNKNAIPFDPEKPFVTSGIRIGTPAVTTRGMKEADMETIAGLIGRALEAPADLARLAAIGAEVRRFTADFPLHLGVEEMLASS